MTEFTHDESMLRDHLDFARRLAAGLTRDPALGDDVVQEAMAARLSQLPVEPRSERAFLRTLIRRFAGRERRSTRRRGHREEGAARPEALPATDELVAAMEIHRIVVDELMELGRDQRAVLLMRFFDDLSTREIAGQLGIPVETARTRQKRGLAKLRERLDARTKGERSQWLSALILLTEPVPSTAPVQIAGWFSLGKVAAAAGATGTVFFIGVGIALRADLTELYAQPDSSSYGEERAYAPAGPNLAVPGESSGYQAAKSTEAQSADSGQDAEGIPRTSMSDESEEEPPNFLAALSLELKDCRAVDLPESKGIEAVSKATDWSAKDLKQARLYRASRTSASDVFLARVPVSAPEKDSYAILVLDPDKAYVASVVVDSKGAVIEEWQHFMGIIEFGEVPRLEGARAWSEVEQARAEALEDDSEDARLMLALLDTLQFMNDQASVFNLPPDMREHSEVGEAEMMQESYAKLADLAPALEPLLGDSLAKFEQLAMSSADLAGELVEAVKAKNVGAGRGIQRKIMGSCKDCHNLPHPEFDGGQKDAFKALREELDIGDGYYRVGHDLRIRHPDRKRMQLIADALRAGALLMDASKVSK